jgi:DNA primase
MDLVNTVTLAQLEAYDPTPVRQGGHTRYLCPLSPECREKPRDSAHRSLAVEITGGVFYCHRCGGKGKLREFWEERKQVKLSPKRIHLRPVAPIVSRAAEKKTSEQKKNDLEALREKMSTFAGEFSGSAAEKYLSGRSVPKEISRAAGCGNAPRWEHWEKKNGEWKLTGTDSRVVFPVCDENGDLVAIHSRAIDQEYIHSSKITRGNKSLGVFYSSPEAATAASGAIAICEGPADALALQACGIPAIAMIGTSWPSWLPEKLKDRSILLATDADKAGDDAATKLKTALNSRAKKILRIAPARAKDWAEQLELEGAECLREFFWPFAPEADDVTRVNAAWRFAEEGFYEEGEFVAALIRDKELKDSIRTLVYKEHLKAA